MKPLLPGRSCVLFGIGLLLCSGSLLHAQERPRAHELRRRLSELIRFPGIDDPKTPLSEVLEQLAKRYDLAFDINKQAFKDVDYIGIGDFEPASPTPVPEMHSSIETVLRIILLRLPVSAAFVIRKDVIEITTVAAVRKEFYGSRTEEILPPLVTSLFENQPLERAVKELSQVSGSNVVIDGRVAKEAKTPVTADLLNVPLDAALRVLADMAGLKPVQIDNVFYLTTRENARLLKEEQEQLRLERERNKPAVAVPVKGENK
jgi:hypothetical protein